MTMFMIFIQLILVCWYNGGLDIYDKDNNDDNNHDNVYDFHPIIISMLI